MKAKSGILIFFYSCTLAFAQPQFELSGQIRHRSEIDNKDFSSSTGANSFNLLRSRLALSVSPAENVSVFIQLQDSRGFGEERNTLSDGSADNFDFHQAFFTLAGLFDLPVDLKVGRIELAYGNERLIGAVGWHNIGRSFDGAVLSFQSDNVSADLFSLKEREVFNIENNGDKNVFGIYSNVKFSSALNSDAFLIWQRSTPRDVLNRYTLGFAGTLSLGRFFNQTEFAYQGGQLSGMDVSAMMLAINAGFKFPNAVLGPVLSAGYEYLSGDDDPGDGKVKVFDTLYATNHKFYGFMDFFLNIPAHTRGFGLRDMHADIAISPAKKIVLSGVYHIFNTAKTPNLENLNSNKIGAELDITLKYAYAANVSIIGGLSFFTPGDYMKQSRGNDTATWFYLMTVVNF